MEVNLMNIWKAEGPSIHLAVGKNYHMDKEAWIGQEHPLFLELFDVDIS
jgi:hypothetical protein